MTTPVPHPAGAHPIGPDDNRRRRKGLLWLALLAALIVLALIVLAIVLSRHHGKKTSAPAVPPVVAGSSVAPTASGEANSASAVPNTGSPTDTSTATGSGSGSSTAGSSAGAGTLTAGSSSLLPASADSNADLTKYTGQRADAKNVLVLSAPADNGFWIGTSTQDEVWVQLLLPGLVSPHPVRKGDHVSFPATVVANPSGFAQTADVSAAEGAARLTAQKAHLQVAKNAITFTD